MKVVFTVDYGNENFDKVRALGYEVVLIPEKEIQDSTFPYDADAFCCFNPFDRIDMNKFTNLKMLQLTSIGFDFVPKEDILNNNIVMTNNQGGYSIPMGEFIVFNMLQMAKRNRQFIQTQEEKKWKVDFSLTELYGKTALFLGTGTIATEGAKRLQGFSMNVIGMNTKGTAAQYFDKVYPMDQYKEIFPQADFVISTLPATEQTYHFMNKESMSYLKNSACIINVSRGAIFDQEDLTQMLVDKKLAGAALDVFEIEPLPTDSRLWDLENVYLYPHNSWVSEPMQDRRFDTMYENLRRLIQGEKLMNVVNIPRGY